jgi:hypothetical protein
VHLRWLFTLRHGIPNVRALDPTLSHGLMHKQDDPHWREAREKEYHAAMNALSSRGYAKIVMSLCIYNERPPFIALHVPVSSEKKNVFAAYKKDVRDGLNFLAAHFER